MELNVTLVNPPYRTRPHQHPPFPPLGLGYLAAVLEKNGFEVEVIDCQASQITLMTILNGKSPNATPT